MYSLLLAPFISAVYYSSVSSIDSELMNSTTEESVLVQEFTSNCVDFTLQNEIPLTMTQEHIITCTKFDTLSNVMFSTITNTVILETVSTETVVTCTNADFVVQEITSETIGCSNEHTSVYTTDLFILNSVDLSSTKCVMETTTDLESQTSSIETSIVSQVEDFSSIFGDLEGLETITTDSVTVTSTSSLLLEETVIGGDLEGLPTLVVNDTLPELTIEEIPDIEVSALRDNGLEFCNAVGLENVIANGTQQQFQTCSLTVQGAIPAIDKMVSTIITSPKNNAVIKLGTNFTIIIKSLNIEYGFFDDPGSLYYFSPQRLNSQGIIQGHNHVAIQKLLGPEEVPSAQNPLFFKGLNEESLDGSLSTEVNGAIFTETGEYRLCTSSASQGHQPILSPVARRFFQDDCIRFTIVN